MVRRPASRKTLARVHRPKQLYCGYFLRSEARMCTFTQTALLVLSLTQFAASIPKIRGWMQLGSQMTIRETICYASFLLPCVLYSYLVHRRVSILLQSAWFRYDYYR